MGWNAKPDGGYELESEEGKENALAIAEALGGWTDEAVSAVVGNSSAEGGLNPWRWEIGVGESFNYSQRQVGYQNESFTNLIVQESGRYEAGIIIPAGIVGYSYGYGLFQYTGWQGYTDNATAMATEGYGANFSKNEVTPYASTNDGYVQVRAFAENWLGKWGYSYPWYVDDTPRTWEYVQRIINEYGYLESVEDFGRIDDIELATVAMLVWFEKPANPEGSIDYRISQARIAYEIVHGNVPDEPIPPSGDVVSSSKFIFKIPNRRRKRRYYGY